MAQKKAKQATAGVEAPVVDVVDASNKKVGERMLAAAVFKVRVNDHLIYEAVKHYRAAGRRGTHKTKTRDEVSGSGRKPWKQKGTGRARVAEVRTPLWRHGGTVFGPQPRDYSFSMPKKARRAALRSALSQRTEEGAVRVVESFPEIQVPEQPPYKLTKQLTSFLGGMGLDGKAVLVDEQPGEGLTLSGRNVPGVRVMDESALTVYEVLDCSAIVFSQQALAKLEERLSR